MADSFFKKVAEDLMYLEVNTIIKSQLSGQKMPDSARRTLYEISYTYSEELKKIGQRILDEDSTLFKLDQGFRGEMNWTFGGLASFEELKSRAKSAINWVNKNERINRRISKRELSRDLQMLQRIQDNSHRILGIFFRLHKTHLKSANSQSIESISRASKKDDELIKELINRKASSGNNSSDLDSVAWNNDIESYEINNLINHDKDLKLDVRELMVIRKIWDIGVEEILMQTIVGIDGDVTTRILESFAASPDSTLLKVHDEGIKSSIGFWQKMIDTVSGFVGKTMQQLLDRT